MSALQIEGKVRLQSSNVCTRCDECRSAPDERPDREYLIVPNLELETWFHIRTRCVPLAALHVLDGQSILGPIPYEPGQSRNGGIEYGYK